VKEEVSLGFSDNNNARSRDERWLVRGRLARYGTQTSRKPNAQSWLLAPYRCSAGGFVYGDEIVAWTFKAESLKPRVKIPRRGVRGDVAHVGNASTSVVGGSNTRADTSFDIDANKPGGAA